MPHRLNIMLPPPKHIVHTRNNQHTPKHNHTPVHISHIRRVDDGEETRDASHGHVEHGGNVDRDTEFAEEEARGGERFVAEAFLEDAEEIISKSSWGVRIGKDFDGVPRD
jgi:hypothetical protein